MFVYPSVSTQIGTFFTFDVFGHVLFDFVVFIYIFLIIKEIIRKFHDFARPKL